MLRRCVSLEPRPVKRAKPRQLEHREQKSLFQWAAMMERQIPALGNLFAVPNGGKRNVVTASLLKAEGVRAGVPDVVLAWCVREGPWIAKPGLYIEMKIAGNTASESQIAWRDRLIATGYSYVLAFNWRQAANAILGYLGPEYSRFLIPKENS